MLPKEIVREVTESGLRGRGGAAFPTGIKWQTVLDTPSATKYIVCNADEGDSGTYADRMMMESDPFAVIEGMIIAGLAVGADRGYIYLREEYRYAEWVLNEALKRAEAAQFLGQNILGSDQSFRIEVRLGAGAYICGEETALLESLEGKRGMVRPKPPLPAIHGLWQQPTVINNVLTLATVPIVLAKGAAFYADFGVGRSRGTLPVQLAGNLKQAGLVEIGFGQTLRTLLTEFGGGSRSGRAIRAVQVGGPLGAFLPASAWDTPLDYEAFARMDAMLGHGGVVVFDESVDLSEQARFAMTFCAVESCGKCTPCRIGAVRGVEVIDKIMSPVQTQAARQDAVDLLKDLCDTMIAGSLCAMGGMTPYPVLSALEHFPEDFRRGEVIATDAMYPL
jgi:formate dehydrogenase iron-sulfur subunit